MQAPLLILKAKMSRNTSTPGNILAPGSSKKDITVARSQGPISQRVYKIIIEILWKFVLL